jgi:hypothetical protein
MGWATLWVSFSQSRLVTLLAVEKEENRAKPRLPDGIFSDQKSQFG